MHIKYFFMVYTSQILQWIMQFYCVERINTIFFITAFFIYRTNYNMHFPCTSAARKRKPKSDVQKY